MNSNKYKYDVFISHAVEDKMSIATDLDEQLRKAGLKVWYSGNELGIGARIEKSIHKGLEQSRFGIVILSPDYLNKTWTLREFYSLLAKEKKILPVLHNVTIDDLKAKDITIADTFGISSDKGLDVVVAALVKEIKRAKKVSSTKKVNKQPIKASLSMPRLIGLAVILMLSFYGYTYFTEDVPDEDLITSSIEQRLEDFQNKITNDHLLEMNTSKGKASTKEEITKFYTRFSNLTAQYRNEYEFYDGYEEVNFKKNIEAVLGIDLESLAPFNTYGFKSPDIYLFDYKPNPHIIEAKYVLLNTQPTTFSVQHEEMTEDYRYLIQVNYENNIRYLAVNLTFSKNSDWKKKSRMTLKGFLPHETYIFRKEGDDWAFAGIENNH